MARVLSVGGCLLHPLLVVFIGEAVREAFDPKEFTRSRSHRRSRRCAGRRGRSGPLLDIRGLRTHFFTEAGVAKAVDGVDLDIYPGEVVGLVGESGSGKSVTALSVLRLIQSAGQNRRRRDHLQGPRPAEARLEAIRKVRGNEISMIFQEPMTSLNPVFTIGLQLDGGVSLHEKRSKQEAVRSRRRDARAGRHPRSPRG